MQTSIEVYVSLRDIQNISAVIDDAPPIVEAQISKEQKNIEAEFVGIPALIETYDGSYVITPGLEQRMNTADKKMAMDVIINPIPSNYGKITYNGAVLTVS